MDNKKIKLILIILLVIIFILGIIYLMSSLKIVNISKYLKTTQKQKTENYLNIDRSKVIENPTTKDLQRLIEKVQNQ